MRALNLENRTLNRACFCRFLFIPALLLISFLSKGQCIASAVRNASAAVNDATVGTIAFTSPGNISSSDNSRAEADALAVLFSGSTQYLKATGFGFSIPSYSSICGVVVEIERRDGGFLSLGTGLRDNEVKLVKANTVTGNNLGTSTNWGTSEVYATYGSSSNLWGTTLTPAEVNASNFGVVISARYNGLATLIPSAQVDNIRMTVYYNPVLPTHLIAFTSVLKKGIVHLEWKTADEEDDEFITLQRSVTGESTWTDIASFEMHSGNSGKIYSYEDVPAKKGNYSYRLRITNVNSQTIYSETKNVRFTGDGFLSVYPNPASDFIIIDNAGPENTITITNLYMQSLKLPVQHSGNGTSRVDIRQLPRGIYFASLGVQKIKFLRE